MTSKKTVGISAQIPEEQYINLKIKAAKERVTLTSLIEKAIDNLLATSTTN